MILPSGLAVAGHHRRGGRARPERGINAPGRRETFMPVRRARRTAMAAVGAAALAGFSLAPAAAAGHSGTAKPRAVATARGGWPQFGFGADRTGDNPSEHILGPGNVAGLRQKWSFLASGRVETSPALANGVVYFSDFGSHLYAARASTGAKMWSFAGVPPFAFSDPAVAGGIVYALGDGRLYARDAATGRKVWTFVTPGEAGFGAPPAVVGGVVYFASDFGLGGAVYALDAATGKMLWSFTTSRRRPQSSVAVAGGVVYEVTSDDDGVRGSAYALDAATGKLLWHVSSPGPLFTPTVAHGILYTGFDNGTDQARLEALKASTGGFLWLTPPVGQDIFDWPAVAGSLVYVGSLGVDAFNAVTGKPAWEFPLPSGSAVDTEPVVANGIVYITGNSDNTLYALDAATGHKLATISDPGIPATPAVVVNGTVYLGGFDQRLRAYALP